MSEFYSQLMEYYAAHKKDIMGEYAPLTRKFLAYNDPSENHSAFLRLPQFEALSMYVFVKEYMNNAQVWEMFDDWRKRTGKFSGASYYVEDGRRTEELFARMKRYREDYPNYIYALTMGLGKTILIAACIFYEFLLARKFPADNRYCHNVLVFAPDKTVLQSLREIKTFDKAKVVPPEYVGVLETNIHFHFLDDSDTKLATIDGSDYNIVISNTQKIILKKKHKPDSPAQVLFSGNELRDESSLVDNQRFERLCRLPRLGVYVDEAHHLFGSKLEETMRAGNTKKTSLRDTINTLAKSTSIVGCYNYTGTPYVDNQILPEVVYAYGLRESIRSGYLKNAEPFGYANVKNEEFLLAAVSEFWERYGGRTYEGLTPKLAVYAASVDEAVREVRPVLENILSEMNIPATKILVNVGDTKYTKDDDIREFNALDTEDSEKQFIILVEKGKEGWNCRSLFGVALYRSPKSKIFVLQATMRCLRSITNDRQTASIFLSKENYDILNDELHKNFNMEIRDMTDTESPTRKKYQVHVVPPLRRVTLKVVTHEYSLTEKTYTQPVDFGLADIDLTRYESTKYTGGTITSDNTPEHKTNIDYIQQNRKYSELMLVAELSRCMNISCVLAAKILRESADGVNVILDAVSRYNAVIYDVIIPAVFRELFEVAAVRKTEDKELVLLREPKNAGYYEFSAIEDLVLTRANFTDGQSAKSFHADTYCFDSWPERICFEHYMRNNDVREVYFTGMFTAGQGDLFVNYYDPESGRLRQYYPDFIAIMNDGSYRLIEVKGDRFMDENATKAKSDAAREMSTASGVEYVVHRASEIMRGNIA